MQAAVCAYCGAAPRRVRSKYCTDRCERRRLEASESYKAARRRYEQSEKGLAARRRYNNSAKYKLARRRHTSGEKYKETRRRYRKSVANRTETAAARQARLRCQYRYASTERGRESRRRYINTSHYKAASLVRAREKYRSDPAYRSNRAVYLFRRRLRAKFGGDVPPNIEALAVEAFKASRKLRDKEDGS